MRYNLEFRELTFYGLTRKISGQTILSSQQDLDFGPNFPKNGDIPVVKNSVTRPITPAVQRLITCQIPAYNLYYIFQYSYLILIEESFCLDTVCSAELLKSRLFWATGTMSTTEPNKNTLCRVLLI